MKRSDFYLLGAIVLVSFSFFLFPFLGEAYDYLNATCPYLLAFVKFAILSTLGEMMGLRIKSGKYLYAEFGMAPRAILWGFYGVWIAIAMKTFANGAPAMVETLGVEGVRAAMGGEFSGLKLLGAFSISVMMNTIFAPVFMTLHKATDAHIVANGGSICSLVRPINMGEAFSKIDWPTQWGFVFGRTIPFFWIPAHTITFLLPSDMQVLFAALLSIFLGVLLSIAVVISQSKR